MIRYLFFLTPLKWAIHAFMNVFLSGIQSRLRTGFKDLPFSLARFSSSSFLFFLNCSPDGFSLFIISFVEVAWTHTLTKPLNVLACSDYTKEVRTPSSFDFWLVFPLRQIYFFNVKILVGDIDGAQKTCWAQFSPMSPVGRTGPVNRG